jgi:hypothetical protein
MKRKPRDTAQSAELASKGYLTIDAAAALAKVPSRTLRTAFLRGRLPGCIHVRHRVYVSREGLASWIGPEGAKLLGPM